jgi:hypothetical protein
MATITVESNFDVINKYEQLTAQALSGESAYIRAKETIEELVASGSLDDAQKAEVISSVIGTIAASITSAGMSTALQWASAEKDFALRKLELAEQLDILTQENLLKLAQIEQIDNTNRLAKVESRRMYGISVFDGNDNIVSLDDSGKVYTEMQLVDAQRTKTGVEETLTTQKITESQAAVHKIVADTYVNYGNYTYTTPSVTGITSITANHGVYKTLSDTQQDIAIEQAKGYTYNAWANALTGSASMLGTAMAAEYAEFGAGQPGAVLLDTVLNTALNLKAATTTTDEAIPTN